MNNINDNNDKEYGTFKQNLAYNKVRVAGNLRI
jgi:hypothetical protein